MTSDACVYKFYHVTTDLLMWAVNATLKSI